MRKDPTVAIYVCTLTHSYRISGKTGYWKTFKGAIKAATRRGYVVSNETVDPMIAFSANYNKTKIVQNMLSGKLVRIPVNSPLCCDPSSETYWSM